MITGYRFRPVQLVRRVWGVNMYRRVNTIEQEESLLNEILRLEMLIRKQRETNRLQDSSRRNKYTRMFEPVTKTLKTLKASTAAPATASASNALGPSINPLATSP